MYGYRCLGFGCSKCHSTTGLIERVAKDVHIPVNISLNVSKEERERLGIHATPAVLIDGRLVHSGGIPSHEKVQVWLRPKPLDLLNAPTRYLFLRAKVGWVKHRCPRRWHCIWQIAASRCSWSVPTLLPTWMRCWACLLATSPHQCLERPVCPFSTLTRMQRLEAYRQRVVEQMARDATTEEVNTVREQLSGACTTEIASFDELSLLADQTKSTTTLFLTQRQPAIRLRLLSLPKAWSGFGSTTTRAPPAWGPIAA